MTTPAQDHLHPSQFSGAKPQRGFTSSTGERVMRRRDGVYRSDSAHKAHLKKNRSLRAAGFDPE